MTGEHNSSSLGPLDDVLVAGWDWQPPVLPPRAPGATPHLATPIVTPLRAERWATGLARHPNRALVEYVTTGIRRGFHTGSNVEDSSPQFANASSALLPGRKEAVDKWVRTEREAGRYIQIKESHHPYLRIHPLNTTPKRSYEPGVVKWRICVNESKGSASTPAVNDGIDREACSMNYITIRDIIAPARAFGANAHMNHLDMRNAFRNLPKHPTCTHLHCVRWGSQIYVDVAIAFGNRSSPRIFDSVAIALEYILQEEVDRELGGGNVVVRHYLDDVGMIARNKETAERAYTIAIRVYSELGIPISEEKSLRAANAGEYLGIWIDLKKQEISPPPSKKKAYLDDTITMASWSTATKRELLELLGRVGFAHIIFPRARPFVNELIRLSCRVKKLHHRVSLTSRLKSDLKAWEWLLREGKPKSMLDRLDPKLATPITPWPINPPDIADGDWLVGDASGISSHGFGFFGKDFHSCRVWEQGDLIGLDRLDADASSTLLETICMASAVMTWLHRPTRHHKHLYYYCDNQGVAWNHQTGRSRSTPINNILRRLVQPLISADITLHIVWRPRNEAFQVAADALSHQDPAVASRLMQHCLPFVIPQSIPMAGWTLGN